MTPWTLEAWRLTLQTASTTAILLAVGCLAVRACRSPVRQARLATLTLAGCLLAPMVGLIPGLPRWSVLDSPPTRPDRGDDPKSVRSVAPAVPERDPIPLGPARTTNRTETGELSPTPTPADKPPRRPTIDPRAMILAAHWLEASAWLGCWCMGHWVLLRVVRSARPVPPEVRARFLAIAGPGGAGVRLLETDRVRLPITFTWLRPTIILPLDLHHDPDGLRFALGHEWSHVERRDHQAWTLASLVGLLAFYNPCYWLLRRQLRLSQDYLADDRAAATGSPLDFASHLVRLARSRLEGAHFPLPALGIGSRRSHLARRVIMLSQDRPPHETRCRPLWTGAVVALTGMLLVAASGIRLDASPQLDEPRKSDEPRVKADTPKGREWVGQVVDKETGQPIAGAKVRVKIGTSRDPKTNGFRDLRSVESTAPADGSYRFTLTPEEEADRFLYITLYVNEPEHVQRYGGYSYAMMLKNIELGERPFFEKLDLFPAKAVEGVVLKPDGAPAAGVKINGYSKRNVPREAHDFGQFCDTRTDAQGRFRLPLHREGQAVFWVLPEQFEPVTYPLKNNRRGDLGAIRLAEGIRIKGRVIDADGKPFGGIYVGVDRDTNSGKPIEGIPNGVGDNIFRSSVTLDDGTFTLGPMPLGAMEVKPNENGWDPATRDDAVDAPNRPLPAVFLGQIVNLEAGKEPGPITIRAVPQVRVTAQIYDSKGEKKGGFESWLSGRLDGRFWSTQAKPSRDGIYSILAPKGLEGASFDLMSNEHGTLMYRITKGDPLNYRRQIDLGKLDHDVEGIEIIRYVSPIILIKATTKDGQLVKGVKVAVNLVTSKQPGEGGYVLKGGVTSDISLEGPQEDGRFRTSQLPPDTEVEVKVAAEGFAPQSRKLSLPEGKTEEMAFVLEPK